MALADTIHELLAQQKIGSTTASDKNLLLAEWQKEVSYVLGRVQATIQPYVDSGSAIIESNVVTIGEELLGTYEIQQLAFVIADRRIVAAPVARFTFGGDGRIDLYRDDRPSERDRFLIVRQASEGAATAPSWLMENKEEAPSDAPMSPRPIRRSNRRFYLLSQAVIESAIDYLLKMK